MICPNCKQNNSDDSRFCKKCGATLAQPKVSYCKSCGRMLAPNARFCPACGERKPLRIEGTQPQPTTNGSPQGGTNRVHIVERPTNYDNTYGDQPQKPKKDKSKEKNTGCGCIFHLIFFFVVAILGAGYYYMQLQKKERAAYEKVKKSMNIGQMEEYLNTDFYVLNDHKDDIRDRIERIRTDNVDYRTATTIAACERYLDRHPEGRYRKEIEKRLEHLRKKGDTEEIIEDVQSTARQTIISQPSSPISTVAPSEDVSTAEEEVSAETGGTKYYIQVGYRNKREDADASAKRNAEKGFGNVVVKTGDNITRHYITTKAYNSKEEAAAQLENIRKQYPDATIISE